MIDTRLRHDLRNLNPLVTAEMIEDGDRIRASLTARFLRRHLSPCADREAFEQASRLALWGAVRRYDGTARWAGWAGTCVQNALCDEWRAQLGRKDTSLRAVRAPEARPIDSFETLPDPDDDYHAVELQLDAERLLAILSPRDRAFFRLKADGYSDHELAGAAGLSLWGLRHAVYTGRRKMLAAAQRRRPPAPWKPRRAAVASADSR